MPRTQILNHIEKQALEHIASCSSAEVSKRAKVLLMLNEGEKWLVIAEKAGLSKKMISKWKKRWVESNFRPENWDDAILKVEQVLYGEVGRPKKLKVTEEISKIVEISEWCKTRKPSKTTYQHNKQVAEAAKLEGLPEVSPRTVGRVLKDNKNQKLMLDVSNL